MGCELGNNKCNGSIAVETLIVGNYGLLFSLNKQKVFWEAKKKKLLTITNTQRFINTNSLPDIPYN